MGKFKDVAAAVVGATLGLGVLWLYVTIGFNPITAPYDGVRKLFHWGINTVLADTPKKVWIVVDMHMPNGEPASMAFDNPEVPDLTLSDCESVLPTALAGLKSNIETIPQLKGAVFKGAKCVESDNDPVKP